MVKLSDFSLRKLDEICAVKWLAHVGEPSHGEWENAIYVKAWSEALAHAGSEQWGYTQEKIARRFLTQLYIISVGLAIDWVARADNIYKQMDSLVADKLKPVVIGWNREDADVLIISITYDLLHYVMECEHHQWYPSGGFFTLLMRNVYEKGRFPCGWIGELDTTGRLMLF